MRAQALRKEDPAEDVAGTVRQSGAALVNARKENGWTVSDGSVEYQIAELRGNDIGVDLLGRMMALQDEVALVKSPDASNFIDYKSKKEAARHYENGGIGLGIFAGGELAGQLMLSFNEAAGVKQATIGWLMVDPLYRGNQLCESLISLAVKAAAEHGAEQVAASVRLHNKIAVAKFANAGFVAAGTGQNAKDGSAHVKFVRPADKAVDLGPEISEPITLKGLKDAAIAARFNDLTVHGTVGKWDNASNWFTFHKPSPRI